METKPTKTELLQLVIELKKKMIQSQDYELASAVHDIERKIESTFTKTTPEAYEIRFEDTAQLEEFLANLQIQYPDIFQKFISQLDTNK